MVTKTKQRIDIVERNGLFLIPAAAILKSAVDTTVSEETNQGSSPPALFIGFASDVKDIKGDEMDINGKSTNRVAATK